MVRETGAPSAERSVRPGYTWCLAEFWPQVELSLTGHGTSHGRDTFVTHNLDGCPELARDAESRKPCSAAISKFRPGSPRRAHQFMLYYDI